MTPYNDEEEKATVITKESVSYDLNDQNCDFEYITLLRTFQIFVHDMYVKVPSEIEEQKFDEFIEKISSTNERIFGKYEDKDLSIHVSPLKITEMQDNLLLNYEYLEIMFGDEAKEIKGLK